MHRLQLTLGGRFPKCIPWNIYRPGFFSLVVWWPNNLRKKNWFEQTWTFSNLPQDLSRSAERGKMHLCPWTPELFSHGALGNATSKDLEESKHNQITNVIWNLHFISFWHLWGEFSLFGVYHQPKFCDSRWHNFQT